MKKTAALLCLFGSLIAQQTPESSAPASPPSPPPPAQITETVDHIEWLTDYSVAQALSKNTNKPILLFFTGSDWCTWCMKAEREIFTSSDFIQAAGNQFVFVLVDFPMNEELPMQIVEQNEKLKDQYGVKGFPTVILVSPTGQTIATVGYEEGGGARYANMLLQLLQPKK